MTAHFFRKLPFRLLLASVLPSLLSACGGGGGDGSQTGTPTHHVWVTTGSMLTGRDKHTATLLPNGKVLVAGGGICIQDPCITSSLASAEIYDPSTGTWTYTGSMNTARSGHTATLLPNGSVLVAGGTDTNGLLASAELYDPATGKWTYTGSMNAGGGGMALLLPDGIVLVTGYADGTAELYDPSTGTWSYTGSGGSILSTLLQDGNVLSIGYPLGGYLLIAELYDPAAGTWSPTGTISGADNYYGPFFSNLTSLQNGKALTAGGGSYEGGPKGATPSLSGAYLYDPATGVWTSTGNMTSPMGYPTATLLQDGTVLMVGAAGNSPNIVAGSAELYDPTTGAWTDTGRMRSTHRFDQTYTATMLQNGTVLVAGGCCFNGNIADAEIYVP